MPTALVWVIAGVRLLHMKEGVRDRQGQVGWMYADGIWQLCNRTFSCFCQARLRVDIRTCFAVALFLIMYDHVFGVGVVYSSVKGQNLFVLSIDSSWLKWLLLTLFSNSKNCSIMSSNPTCSLALPLLCGLRQHKQIEALGQLFLWMICKNLLWQRSYFLNSIVLFLLFIVHSVWHACIGVLN